ncbi:SDR family oxidoreductase [Myceligenerans pegani]|uniref:SDR family oxidoreductase n=1 Tax=Myceligenerans pegani TaxID=2776917 RepID=A0ABR9N3E4_9MICO|nr:SDR family oxidoreductase [Myceligenerans sp. TRM 65318]MBE1878176.1 SDR family oxidoreductase [Myceligenerans sp. TRM 65318]MBE3020447.1 SDR family oxidoreductase [Myceligenerans sp. TRM 65318]
MATNEHPNLAITGATGHVGGAVFEHLRDSGLPIRLVVRDAERAPEGARDVAEASFGDRGAATAALRGIDVLFMVSAAESADRLDEHRTFVDAAAAAGVRHVVYTSFLGAAADATFTLARTHWATEQHLRESGMAWTFLRNSFYLDVFPLFAGQEGVIRGPAGDGRVGAVARADVARAAAVVLRDAAAHEGRTYELTGPEALTLSEIARVIAQATGRTTTYEDETLEQAYRSREPYGAPDWQVEAWVSTYTAIAAGELDVVTDDVERLTGTPPLSLADLLRGS